MYFNFNRRGLRVGFCIIGGLCISLPLFRCSDLGVRASADDIDIILSYEETLALYGTRLSCSYYNNNSGTTTSCYAEFIGYTDMWVPSNHWDEMYWQWVGTSNNNVTPDWSFPGGLVYILYNWGGGSFVSSSTDNHFNITFNQSLVLEGLSRYRQQVFWSKSDGVSMSFNRSRYTIQSNNGSWFNLPSRDDSYNAIYGLLPLYRPSSDSDIREGLTGQFYGIESDHTSTISFSVTGCTLGANNCGLYPVVGTYNGNTFVDTDAIYIIVGRPILSGSNPSFETNYTTTQNPTTTTTATTVVNGSGDVNVTVDVNIDVSGIESRLDNIIENQDSQLDVINDVHGDTSTHTVQLNTIIEQLNYIYADMVKNGDIDLSLVNVHDIPIDSSVDSRISGDLASGVEQYPEITEFDTDKLSSFGDFLGRIRAWFPVELVSLGALTIALSFVTWFLFRGRGS